jgi:hypothetical protein
MLPIFNFALDTARDHRNILECLEKKEGQRSEKEMVQHLHRLERYLVGKDQNVFLSADMGSNLNGTVKKVGLNIFDWRMPTGRTQEDFVNF